MQQGQMTCRTQLLVSPVLVSQLHLFIFVCDLLRIKFEEPEWPLYIGFEDFKGVRPPTRYEVLAQHKLAILL